MAWEQLLSVYAEAEAYMRDEQKTPPTACPYDGEPLSTGRDGVLHCRFDGYEYPRDRRII